MKGRCQTSAVVVSAQALQHRVLPVPKLGRHLLDLFRTLPSDVMGLVNIVAQVIELSLLGSIFPIANEEFVVTIDPGTISQVVAISNSRVMVVPKVPCQNASAFLDQRRGSFLQFQINVGFRAGIRSGEMPEANRLFPFRDFALDQRQ